MVAEDDARLGYFAEALKARGVNAEPWQIEQFRDLKDEGFSEAQIIHGANQRASVVRSRLLRQSALQGAATGAVAFPLLGLLKKSEHSWREAMKKSSKSAGVGALIGLVAALGYEKVVVEAHNESAEAALKSFTDVAPQMELAWTEIVARRAALKEESPAVSGESTVNR